MPEIISVVGARPQFVKATVVSRAFAAIGMKEVVVHTGQHYDEAMSGRFEAELGMKNISVNLTVGSGSHAYQTARIMMGMQDYLDQLPNPPKAIVVYGDTNSTVAAGLVAAKNSIPLAHVEAGLRSFNRSMPEEINRVTTDHLSNLLYCSSETGVKNLAAEGITRNVLDVGDVMLDGFLVFREEAKRKINLQDIVALGNDTPFCLATIHRPSNTNDLARLQSIVSALGDVNLPVVWPVHPRNKAALKSIDIPCSIFCIEPVGYLQMLVLLDACASVLTDSGGLQKEAHWAQKPCITLRSETEWTETLDGSWNVLADPERESLVKLINRTQHSPWKMLYGDGNAARNIASDIVDRI
ncbi:UDP-2,3-diacetamido-2,3-dideoxy-D-glucuronate 2-epimerase [Roseibium album]|nr:UDP-2,3-diacetamido-2,3-dideoxy-D-glucuronate 2-epimerase [Roseibium album]